MLLSNRGFSEAWRMGYLTELDQLPDYDQISFYNSATQGAPVDGDGKPIFYHEPKSWDAAQNDGERWRFSLAQAAENDPARRNEARYQLAEFLHNQFGVQTMAYYGTFLAVCKMQTEKQAAKPSTTPTLPMQPIDPVLGSWRR